VHPKNISLKLVIKLVFQSANLFTVVIAVQPLKALFKSVTLVKFGVSLTADKFKLAHPKKDSAPKINLPQLDIVSIFNLSPPLANRHIPTVIGGSTIFVNPVTSDIWVVLPGGSLTGKLYKQTGGTGPFAEYTCNIAFNYGKVIVNPITNDIFIADPSSYGSGKLIKQTGGSGLFTTLLATTVKDVDVDYASGTVYVIAGYNSPPNGIYKQTSGTGSFILQGVVYGSGDSFSNNYGFNTLCVEPTTLNVLANFSMNYGVTNRIYQQINYAAGTPDLQGGTLKLNAGTGKGTGASDIEMYTGQVLASGTDMQTATLRAKIDNTGLMTLPSVTNALIEADIKSLPTVNEFDISTPISLLA